MNAAEALLEMQGIDLDIQRARHELLEVPELKELARKRASLKRLKSEAKVLLGNRKDLEIDIDDLAIDRKNVEKEVEATQRQADSLDDYRQVQDFQDRLAELAKKLDKIAFESARKSDELEKLNSRISELEEFTARFEEGMLSDASVAREKATAIQEGIAKAQARRERLVDDVPAELMREYEGLLEQKKGLAVERLEGSVPSICRMTLSEASLSDIDRSSSIARCPNCGRLLVLPDGGGR